VPGPRQITGDFSDLKRSFVSSQFTFIQLRAGAADCRVVLREYVLFVQPSLFQLYWLESTGMVGDTCCGTILFVLVGSVLSVILALNLTVALQYTICIDVHW
jgi:hypothetical protein